MADAQLPVADAKAKLVETDDAFRQLVSEHQALDDQIAKISHQSFLSHQQQFEEALLKKKKLLLKDRIEAILRSRYGQGLAEASTT